MVRLSDLSLAGLDDVNAGVAGSAKLAAAGIDCGAKVAAIGTGPKFTSMLPRVQFPDHVEMLRAALFGDPDDEDEEETQCPE